MLFPTGTKTCLDHYGFSIHFNFNVYIVIYCIGISLPVYRTREDMLQRQNVEGGNVVFHLKGVLRGLDTWEAMRELPRAGSLDF